MRHSPKTILFFDHTAKLSGGEILLLNLLNHWDYPGYKPVVVLGEDGPLYSRLVESGIETHILPLSQDLVGARKNSLDTKGIIGKISSLGRLWTYTWRLSRLMRRSRARLVHTNSLKADLLGGIAGRLAGVPVVWHIHDRIAADYLPGSMVRLFRFAAKFIPHHIICVSQAVRDTFPSLPNNRVTVVHNGIPVNSELLASSQKPLNISAPVIGLIARISPWKGQDVFVESAFLVKKTFTGARFQIIGAPLFEEVDYERKLIERISALGLEDTVELLGFRSDVEDVISKLDIVVHASTVDEPFGLCIIEGMLASKPVIATRGGAIPEIMEDGTSGLMVPKGDAEALAVAIQTILANEDMASQLGRQGRQRVLDKFTIQHTVKGINGVYDRMLA